MSTPNQPHQKFSDLFIISVSLGMVLLAFLIKPISQNPEYHNFADQLSILGISNFFNVVTNIPFIIVGIWGICQINRQMSIVQSYRNPVLGYFLGILLTGMGSSIYHLNPNNQTLLWDRLPMTIAFMSLLGFLIESRISKKWGQKLYIPLFLLGVFSVIYWGYTESQGRGDLRAYGLVQFGSLILTPLILWLYPKANVSLKWAYSGFFSYLIAKVFESLDVPIHDLLTVCGGHPLKHLAAGMATCFLGLFILEEFSKSKSQTGSHSPTK